MRRTYDAWWRRLLRWGDDRWRIFWNSHPREERHSCERRATEIGPWPRGRDLDRWEQGSWTRYQWRDALRRRLFTLRNPGGSMGSTLWPGPGPVPRVCSFDGGIHPEDAIRLVQAGWEVDGTSKSYKRYLEPPGYRAAMLRLAATPGTSAPRWNGPSSPIPPIKVYVQHFSLAQIERFNQAINDRAQAAV